MPEEPKEEKKGFFAAKPEPGQKLLADISNQVNNISRSLKTLEDRYTTLRKRLQIIEQNMLSNDKRLFDDVKGINSDTLETKRGIKDFNEKLMIMSKELKLSATKEEVAILSKYINYWEPLNFVTRNELDKIIGEKLTKS